MHAWKVWVGMCFTSAYSHGTQLEVDGVYVHDCIIHAVHVGVAAHAHGAL